MVRAITSETAEYEDKTLVCPTCGVGPDALIDGVGYEIVPVGQHTGPDGPFGRFMNCLCCGDSIGVRRGVLVHLGRDGPKTPNDGDGNSE